MKTLLINSVSICILVAVCFTNCGAESSSEATTRNLLQAASQNLIKNDKINEGTEPLSDACKQFPYTRYFRVDSMEDFRYFGENAEKGDMVELVPGNYNLGDGQIDPDLPNTGGQEEDDDDEDNGPPTMATSGTIDGRIGTKEQPIIFCGTQGGTTIDGADSVEYAYVGIRVLKSQYVRLAGFTIQNAMKGKDKKFPKYLLKNKIKITTPPFPLPPSHQVLIFKAPKILKSVTSPRETLYKKEFVSATTLFVIPSGIAMFKRLD
jgi:hypothetical protein